MILYLFDEANRSSRNRIILLLISRPDTRGTKNDSLTLRSERKNSYTDYWGRWERIDFRDGIRVSRDFRRMPVLPFLNRITARVRTPRFNTDSFWCSFYSSPNYPRSRFFCWPSSLSRHCLTLRDGHSNAFGTALKLPQYIITYQLRLTCGFPQL